MPKKINKMYPQLMKAGKITRFTLTIEVGDQSWIATDYYDHSRNDVIVHVAKLIGGKMMHLRDHEYKPYGLK